MNHKYNVGDSVIIVTEPLEVSDWIPEMDSYTGEIATITSYHDEPLYYYNIDIDGELYAWWDECFIPYEEPIYKIDDKVRIISVPPKQGNHWPGWIEKMNPYLGTIATIKSRSYLNGKVIYQLDTNPFVWSNNFFSSESQMSDFMAAYNYQNSQ